jgi:ribosomal protein S18 acetylase RimI-like enzyme
MFAASVDRPVSYFKRFRMEVDLQQRLPAPELPGGYRFVPWDDALLEVHAEVKYQCFVDQLDALVFPSLGNRDGCSYLMQEIRRKSGFQPGATWLIAAAGDYCATVQGLRQRPGTGAIQNLGVVAAHRGRGLGAALLLKALHGFQQAGMHRAFLEVTAQNDGAMRLYRRFGFRCRKTIYKTVSPQARWQPPEQDSRGDWFI